MAPQYLTGTLPTTATPTSCSNSFLLNAGQVQPPEGYTMTLASISRAATFNCPGVANGYSNYSILLTPNNPILAARSFFMAQDGVLHFNDSAPAGPADPVYSITSSNGIVTVGNPANPGTGTGTASNSLVTVWSSTPAQNYVQGSEVLRPAIANGVACGSTNGPQFFGIHPILRVTTAILVRIWPTGLRRRRNRAFAESSRLRPPPILAAAPITTLWVGSPLRAATTSSQPPPRNPPGPL